MARAFHFPGSNLVGHQSSQRAMPKAPVANLSIFKATPKDGGLSPPRTSLCISDLRLILNHCTTDCLCPKLCELSRRKRCHFMRGNVRASRARPGVEVALAK